MIKRFTTHLSLLFFVLAPTISGGQAGELATVKAPLPEFRDISVWKGRAGLILFSPGGKYLAVSGKNTDVVIYETETGKVKSRIDGNGFRAFSFSPDAKFAIAQNNQDLSMAIFDIDTGKSVREIRGLGKLSNLNKMFGGSGLINEINGIFPTVVLEMGRVPVTKNWKNILVNKNDKEFAIFDFETGSLRYELEHENFNSGWESAKLAFAILGAASGSPAGFMLLGSASNPQFSENGAYLLVANGNKKPTLWHVETGKLISKFDAGERVFYTRFSPDNTMVATSDYRGITKIWSTETGELISTIGSKKERGVIAGWNKTSSKVLIVPLRKGDLRAYDSRSGAPIYGFEKSMPGGTLLSDDSTLLVTAPRKNKTVLFQIWETDTGKLLASVPRVKEQDALISVRWSPTNEYIVTSEGLKEPIKIWNSQGEGLQTLFHSTMPMRFSDDGKYLATGGVMANTKIDTGYIWEFTRGRFNERFAILK